MRADVDRFASFAEHNIPSVDLKRLDSGVKLSSFWSPTKILANHGGLADFVGGPLIPYTNISLNSKAVSMVSPLIGEECELIPYTYKEWKYWALSITSPTDCLDAERTEYWTKNRIAYNIRKVVFVPEKLPKDQHVFRIPGGTKIYVTQQFKQAVKEAGLTGLIFGFAWSSDGSTPPPDEPMSSTSASVKGPRIGGRRSKREKLLERLWGAIDHC